MRRISVVCLVGVVALGVSGAQITSFNHFSGLTVANGRVYLGTYDGTLYCFGLEDAPRTQ